MADPCTPHHGVFQMIFATRRVFMIQVAAASVAVISSRASAQARRLQESDPEATAVGYAVDNTKVDKARFPKRQAGDRCGTCKAFITSKPGDEWGQCALIDDKLVNSNAWCSSFVMKK
jgi:hypothetical protein